MDEERYEGTRGSVARYVRALRSCRGMTQDELAAKLGVTQAAVSRWEDASSMPSVGRIIDLADMGGCSVGFVLGRW